MAHFHQYVPAVESSKLIHVDTIDEPIAVPQAAFHKILLGGDQLTVARARSAMKQRINSPSPTKRMAGFIPAVEDWHTQTILMEVNIVYHAGFYRIMGIFEIALFTKISEILKQLNLRNELKDMV